MLDYIEGFNVYVKPEKVFSLSEMPEAHVWLDSSESFGKVVVTD